MTATTVLDPDDYKGVPILYIQTANVLLKAEKERLSLKNAFYGGNWEWHANPKTVFAVAINVMNRKKQCDRLIEKSGILKEIENPEINLVRTLITELLWGKKKQILGNNEVIKTVRRFRKLFRDAESKVANVTELPAQSIVRFCRVNTLKTTVENVVEYLKDSGLTLVETPSTYADFIARASSLGDTEFMVDFHFDHYLLFSEDKAKKIMPDEYHDKSYIIVQDKSSEAAVKLLGVEENSVVADLCAAIGMKTSSIASALNNTGSIYACDLVHPRLQIMKSLLGKHGVANTTFICCDSSRRIKEFKVENVDYVLLDSPCSGSGMIRRPGEVNEENPGRIDKLHNLQCKMLRRALIAYTNAKRLVYSTCSLYAQENEAVVDDILPLAEMNGWSLDDAHKTLPGFTKGSSEYKSGEKCLYFNTERDLTNGFFIAVFKRIAPAPTDVDPTTIPNVVIHNQGKRRLDQSDGSMKRDSKRFKKDRRKKGFLDLPMTDHKDEDTSDDEKDDNKSKVTTENDANNSELEKSAQNNAKQPKKEKSTNSDTLTELDDVLDSDSSGPEEVKTRTTKNLDISQNKMKKLKKKKSISQSDGSFRLADVTDSYENKSGDVKISETAQLLDNLQGKFKKSEEKNSNPLSDTSVLLDAIGSNDKNESEDLKKSERDAAELEGNSQVKTKKSKKKKSLIQSDRSVLQADSDRNDTEDVTERTASKSVENADSNTNFKQNKSKIKGSPSDNWQVDTNNDNETEEASLSFLNVSHSISSVKKKSKKKKSMQSQDLVHNDTDDKIKIEPSKESADKKLNKRKKSMLVSDDVTMDESVRDTSEIVDDTGESGNILSAKKRKKNKAIV